jgi:hypothetical protein
MYSIKVLIVVFGLFVIVMTGMLAFRPKLITDFMLRHAAETWMHVLAAVMRIIIGVALLLYASQSRFPLTLQILGWITVAAGVIVALIPPSKFKQLIIWAFGRFGDYTRIAALAGMILGVFIIYAVL